MEKTTIRNTDLMPVCPKCGIKDNWTYTYQAGGWVTAMTKCDNCGHRGARTRMSASQYDNEGDVEAEAMLRKAARDNFVEGLTDD